MKSVYAWEFPLPRTHTGMLQGNGRMGVMIWGGGSVLNLTIGLADFWDHRGGLPWRDGMSYANIRACLEKSDENGLRRLFEGTPPPAGQPRMPTVLPIGRLEFDFGSGANLISGHLNLANGLVKIRLRKGRTVSEIKLVLDMDSPLLVMKLPESFKVTELRRIPAWKYVGETLQKISFQPPVMFETKTVSGWIQECPADPALAIAAQSEGNCYFIAAARGETAEEARGAAEKQTVAGACLGFSKVHSENLKWWNKYWDDVPEIDIPNGRLRFIYEYGMYKFAGLTHPDGVAATLQGPWIEEYQLPPWSSDYHFNINVQMCYWPAYYGNRLEHLKPLFDMVLGWRDILRDNARKFLGIDDGFMLPLAVDDRGTNMGGFWSGTIDHACTGWVAQMMYRYAKFSGDHKFLSESAYPFMVGAMRVYEEMLERDGDKFSLPLSISPEYRGSHLTAWGKNASFQLACIHMLCENLLEAAGILGKVPRPVWREIMRYLPKAALVPETGWDGLPPAAFGVDPKPMIAIWEGTPLEQTHRHHSHLAGITPFDVFDFEDPQWRDILKRSIEHWIKTGPGFWSGWCIPWAAMIHLRAGHAEAAELWLEIWERVFTNEGHGSSYACNYPAICLMGDRQRPETMQMDAGMSATGCVLEMLMHAQRATHYLFRGAPAAWKHAGFRGIRGEGAFLVSAERKDGRVTSVELHSECGGVFRLANPWKGSVTVKCGTKCRENLSGNILEVSMNRNENIVLKGVGD